ncbi:uncharacterized protein [Amphiura filiformis]|uniref:uncharacterized protein n=1 Tax=Amphiura filiformis TaxID=82378 RepID=UPI003B2206DF
MTSQSSSTQLTFCNDCGCLRLRDVTNQLQELFTKKSIIKPDLCGICNRVVENPRSKNLNSRDFTVQEKQTSIILHQNEDIPPDEVSKIVKYEQVEEDKSEADRQSYCDDDDDGGGGFDDDDYNPDVEDTFDNVAKSSKEDHGGIELNQTVVKSPQKNTQTTFTSEVTIKGSAKSTAANTCTKSKVTTTAKFNVDKTTKSKVKVTKRSKVTAIARSKRAVSTKSKVNKEICVDATGTESRHTKRHTRLSAGVIKAANYQSLLTGDKIDEEEEEDNDEEEEHASDNSFDPDDSDGAGNANDDIESKATDGDNLRKYGVIGVDILDPSLQELAVPVNDQKTSFKCKLCGYDFKRASPFHKHLVRRHDEVVKIDKPFVCLECGKKFPNYKSLASHAHCHQSKPVGNVLRTYKCDHPGCGMTFKTRERLNYHGINHTGRQHMCSWCGLRFMTQGNLSIHINAVHLKIKPYQCSHCEKTFNNKAKRDIHENRIHLKLKQHICEKCGRAFTTTTELTRHMKYHTGEKRHVCDQCEYRCVNASGMARHKMRHTGERPNKCKLCDVAFIQRTSLRAHEKKHHGVDSLGSVSKDPRDNFPGSSSSNAPSSSNIKEESMIAESESKVAIQFLQQNYYY